MTKLLFWRNKSLHQGALFHCPSYGLVVKALDSQSRGPMHVQNHWVAPSLTQPSILLELVKLLPEISGNSVTKNKLPMQSRCHLDAVEPEP